MSSLSAKDAIKRLVRELTHAGADELDARELKKLKAACKQSVQNVDYAYEALAVHLRKKHAQVRLSCIQVIDELFLRSARFRDLVCGDLNLVLENGLGAHNVQLPPPHNIAERLRRVTADMVQTWIAKFADGYHQLVVAQDYLSQHKQTLLQDADQQQQQRRPDLESRRMQLGILTSQISERIDAMEQNLQYMDAVMELLIPSVETLFDNVDTQPRPSTTSAPTTNRDIASHHGLGASTYKLTVHITDPRAVQPTEDNRELLESLREYYSLLIVVHRGLVDSWLASLQDFVDEDGATAWRERLVALQERMQSNQEQAEAIGVSMASTTTAAQTLENPVRESDQESEPEFEPVQIPKVLPAKAKQPDFVPKTSTRYLSERPSSSIFSHQPASDADVHTDPTVARPAPTAVVDDEHPDAESETQLTDRERELLKTAPVLDGSYLYYQDKKDMPFNTSGLERSHRFLGSAAEEHQVSEETLSQLRKRTIALEAKPLVTRQCRAPLRNGKICRRMCGDFCILHGPIIDRDEDGVPADASSHHDGDMTFEEVEAHPASSVSITKSRQKRPASALQPISRKPTAKERLAKRLKATRSDTAQLHVQEAKEMRDRQAFSWTRK
ncbi:hypothetical protein RI367_007606 [Sorochytrium milnesiophthora]